MSRFLRDWARESIIQAAVNAASIAREGDRGDTDQSLKTKADLANAIQVEATKLAKRWGYCDWPGLPATFEEKK